MTDLNERVASMLATLTADGRERGLQVAAYYRGRLVVDAAAGEMDAVTHRPVTPDTLFPVFSCGKGVMSTLAHRFAQRGQLEYDAPIARYWPEFAANGKGGITLRQGLSHAAGLAAIPAAIGTRAQLADWDVMCDAIAHAAPAHAPGERIEYHAITFSWVVGEVLWRVAGKPFGDILVDEVCRPLGLKSFFIGLPEQEDGRVALLDLPATPLPAGTGKPEPIPHWLFPLEGWMNRVDARRACIPASNAISTARDLARHYASLLPGGVDGVELLPPERVALATELQLPAGSEPASNRAGLGYMLGGNSVEMGNRDTSFGHGGHGGSLAFADPQRHFALAFTRSRFAGENPLKQIVALVREHLAI